MDKNRISAFFLFAALAVLFVISPCRGLAADISKKDVASYGAWTVTLNYQDVSNPTCQIWANALSPEMKHAGLITIWRDYKTEKEIAKIIIEVAVMDIKKEGFVKLEKSPIHQFGNKGGVLTGISRDQEGMTLFKATKENFREMINSPNEVFMAIVKDESGNEIAIGTPLDGIEKACAKCGIFD